MSDRYYELRKAQGICVSCGMKAVEGRTLCEECAKRKREDKSRRYYESRTIANPNKKLDYDAKSAFESGMTYGKWRMLQDMKARGEI